MLVVLLAAILAFGAAGASAEPLCTDTWTGPSEGSWTTAEDWSTGKVPSSSDVACIGEGKTVEVAAGTNQVGVLEDKGGLVISGSSLEVTNALEVSSVANLTMNHVGIFKPAGEVDVSGSFSGGNSSHLEGSGEVVIKPGASGSVINPTVLYMAKATLVNEGSFTEPLEAGIHAKEGASIVDKGTLTINGQGGGSGLLTETPGPTPTLTNTGTLQKTEGSEASQVDFSVDNENIVSATSGTFEFGGGGTSGVEKVGAWSTSGTSTEIEFDAGTFALGSTASLSGAFTVSGGKVTVGKVEGSLASLSVTGGVTEVSGTTTLTMTSLSVVSGELIDAGGVHVTSLTMNHVGIFKPAGEVDVTGSFSGGNSSHLEGSGEVVIKPGASGSVINPTVLYMAKATLVNEGSFTEPLEAGIHAKEGASIVNKGTLTINGQGGGSGLLTETPGPTPTLTNTGTLQKTEGSEASQVDFSVDNENIVSATSGTFEFGGGGTSGVEKVGAWSTSGTSTEIEFDAGTFALGSTASLSGAFTIKAEKGE